MLINIYKQLIIMSVVSGCLYLILKLCSAITMKYFTAFWHYYTYVLVFMFSIFPDHKILSIFHFSKYTGNTILPNLSNKVILDLFNENKLDIAINEVKADSLANLNFLPYLLICGTVVFIAVVIVQNYRLNRHIMRVCHLEEDIQTLELLSRCKQEMGVAKKISILVSPYSSTPFLYKVWKPRIVLPDIEFTSEELLHVFSHELLHLKRRDPLLKSFMLLINAVNWFNPLAYIVRYDIDCFCELSCDESVVRSMNSEERRRYCELMLGVLWNVSKHNLKLFSAFSDRRKQFERRMDMIMKIKDLRSKKWIRNLGLMITLVLLLGGTVISYAANSVIPIERGESINGSFMQPIQVGRDIPMEGDSTTNYGGEIGPYDVQLINNAHYVGVSAYEKTFTLSPSNGTELNVWVKNNSSSKTVKFKVIHVSSNTDFGYKSIGPGNQLTRNFYMPGGGGLSGDWKIYVTSDDGHQMDLNISARQY